ncbi:ligase-associated DNA damage response endonuclease PdeM [Fulvivirga lutimaris]|uniref:ligase-associated DNA damage response endonuclease PdeM n=1 Tax=Fulvivirga lutimaris TaxID=1819566 RepID=UPI0012BC3406|nr:ligase-associated DNA damage response endonuclease PdeM [Fulvivirga lutimaris]MTI41394.1 ligase-associated DNA damage response endonuclease PdeM [Fulvivirga lutimaris]
MLEIELKKEKLTLLGEKGIIWEKHQLLLIADLHLGKANHFRRSGIAVPSKSNDQNIERLISLLQEERIERVLFMGDLFHSHYNPSWEDFGTFINSFPEITFDLVIGNHDIMSEHQYTKYGINIYKDPLTIGPFIISHEPMETFDGYNLAGHIHPGVVLRGKARQGIRLPCFHFGDKQGLLPAFGEFTGLHKLSIKKSDKVFPIVEGKVLAV